MSYNKIVTIFILILNIGSLQAQVNILNAQSPDEIGIKTEAQIAYDNDLPLSYGYVDDRDVLWSKTTWEVIDLNERLNFPLYYPVDTMRIGNERRSLFDVIMKNVKNGNITEVYADSYFSEKRTLRDLEATLVAVDTTEFGYEQLDETRDAPNGPYVEEQFINRNKVDASDLLEWHIRGIWYIDKRQGDLRYRLLGIAPVLKSARCKINPDNEAACAPIELFWVWYPGAREILNKALSFNRKNTSQPVSFDHLLNSRRFSAMIYKEDNVQGDRAVADYINENALMQLLESDRIKDQIRNIEIDLWNY